MRSRAPWQRFGKHVVRRRTKGLNIFVAKVSETPHSNHDKCTGMCVEDACSRCSLDCVLLYIYINNNYELQGAKLIGKDKRRTPGTFEHSLLAGHAAAIAPVGANGEVAYAAAMKQRGIEQQHTYAVWSWIVRGANKTETVCLTVAAQTAPPRLLANS